MALKPEQLLVEIEDVIRSMPPRSNIRHNTAENLTWLGRASAAIEEWDPIKLLQLNLAIDKLGNTMARPAEEGYRAIIVLLHHAQHALRLRTVGPTSIAISGGMVFEYFEELRKIIALAKQDILFVDPYLDADFVSRYLGYVSAGIDIRLLTEKLLTSLLPAVEMHSRQNSSKISVRSVNSIHDRYVFIDGMDCYQSGASFKDGAKKAGTVLTQIVDAFPAVKQSYDELWRTAKQER